MKWLVFVLSFLFLLQVAAAVPVISDDFYLNNGAVYDSDAIVASNVLPNTLRLVLSEGEKSELRADIVPIDATERSLRWSLPQGAGRIDIYPDGESCTVVGIEVGSGIVMVEAEGGASANIAVEVKEASKIPIRSFDYEGGEEKPVFFTDRLMRTVVRILITLGAAMVLCALLIAIKRRGERNSDEK